MAEPPQPRDDLPADWSGEIDELVGFEDQLSDHDVADRVFIDRAEAFSAGHALAIEAARREHAAQADGQVVAHRPAGHIEAKTLLAARVDPFGAAQWEVSCELELGDGSRIPIVIDVNNCDGARPNADRAGGGVDEGQQRRVRRSVCA